MALAIKHRVEAVRTNKGLEAELMKYECDMIQNRNEGYREGLSVGLGKGNSSRQTLIAELSRRLQAEGRIEDALRMNTDFAFQDQLAKEYGLGKAKVAKPAPVSAI